MLNFFTLLVHDILNTSYLIIRIEGLSLLQSIPPTTANKQTQAQKQRGSIFISGITLSINTRKTT